MEQADIRELATATWRLEKWLDNLNAERKMAAKSALRNIKKYILFFRQCIWKAEV